MVLSKFQQSAVKKFNKKVHDGLISFQKKPCLCNSSRFDAIFKHDRYGLWHPVVICISCGLIQSNPQLSDEEYKQFYSSDDYRALYEGENFIEISKFRYKESNHIFEVLLPVIEGLNLNTILEFGCGGGWNLFPFYKNGYAITGYDYSSELIMLGKSYGLNLKQGSFAEINSTDKKYDVIILNHVIEHFTDLFTNMASILLHLNTDGILYIGVPNIDNFGKGQFQNAHVYYFSPRTFNYYMKRCGLEVMKYGPAQNIHMYGIFKRLNSAREATGLIEKKQLSHEYTFMRQTIVKGKFKSAIASILENMGIKKPVKYILDFLKIRNQK